MSLHWSKISGPTALLTGLKVPCEKALNCIIIAPQLLHSSPTHRFLPKPPIRPCPSCCLWCCLCWGFCCRWCCPPLLLPLLGAAAFCCRWCYTPPPPPRMQQLWGNFDGSNSFTFSHGTFSPVRRAVGPLIFDQCRLMCKTCQPQPFSLD